MDNTIHSSNKKFLGITLTEGTLKRNIIGSLLIVFVAMLAMMLPVTVLQDFLSSYCNIDKKEISKTVGILAASYSICYFLMAPLWGKLSDTIGRRKVAMLCFSLGMLILPSYGFTRSFWQILVIKILEGTLLSGSLAMAMAAAADYCQMRERGKIMGLFGTVIGIAAMVGIPVGAIIYRIHYLSPFLTQGILYLLCAIIAFLLLKPGLAAKGPGVHPNVTASSTLQSSIKNNLLLKLFTIPKLRFACIVAFLLGGTQQMDMVVFLPWGKHIAGMEREVLGRYLSMSAMLFTGFVVIAGYLSKKAGPLKLILIGVSGTLICYSISAFASHIPAILIAYMSIAVFKAFAYPSGLALAASSSAMEHRGTSMGMYHSARSFGEIFFSLICGFLFSWFNQNLGGNFALLGGLLVPGTIAVIIIIYCVKIIKDEKKGQEAVLTGTTSNL